MTHLSFEYWFRAVGQGLFATGSLSTNEATKHFDWIFDCGTNSKQEYLRREIADFRAGLAGRSVGLFCLSHFDEDHVNGARDLLSLQKVEVLVMPYVPLLRRLLIALETPNISEDYLRFLVDPAGYVFAAAGENLDEVVLIAGGPQPPEQPDEPPPPDRDDDDRWDLRPPDTKLPESPPIEDIHGTSESDSDSWGAVRVFTDERPFTVGGAWEFLFFNEYVPEADLAALRKEAAGILRKHRRGDGSFNGKPLLSDLKPIFTGEFGSSGMAKNKISLVAYSGPIGGPSITECCLAGTLLPVGAAQPWCGCYFCFSSAVQLKVSTVYFGDFPLDSDPRLKAIRKHFQQYRWLRVDVIQVPHHGSGHSWFSGAAAEFSHGASIISSRRVSGKHPSDMVLDDLSAHGIALVNEQQRVIFSGHILSSK